jgi:hypothetical protein
MTAIPNKVRILNGDAVSYEKMKTVNGYVVEEEEKKGFFNGKLNGCV